MLVVFDNDCLLHDPPYETLSGYRVPYFESPARYRAIRKALELSNDKFTFIQSESDTDIRRHIANAHREDYITYIEKAHAEWIADGGNPDGVFPDTFLHQRLPNPITNISTLRPIAKAGCYCFDLSTPITADTFKSAVAAAKVALTAARQLIMYGGNGAETHPYGVFALTRPPGHHAGLSVCGGYCYFNNAAIAARFLQSRPPASTLSANPAKIAILDIDYHHGNGTQEIFYEDPDVFYVSIHATEDYPYLTGFPEEKGSGKGLGYNLNIPLPRGTTGDMEYYDALLGAIAKIRDYDPAYLLVSLGVDTFKDDPISDFKLTQEGYARVGKAISGISKPTLFIMEGGYDLTTIGDNVRTVLESFQERS